MKASARTKVRGWLQVFCIIFALAGIGFATTFVYALNSDSTVDRTLHLISDPVLTITLLASAWLIWRRKKAALVFVYFSLFAMALYTVIEGLTTTQKDSTVEMRVASIVSGILLYGLWALYFKQSRRVKDTLK